MEILKWKSDHHFKYSIKEQLKSSLGDETISLMKESKLTDHYLMLIFIKGWVRLNFNAEVENETSFIQWFQQALIDHNGVT